MDGISSRPLTFEEVIGQTEAKTILVNTLKHGKLYRAYLVSGPYGTGKTTLAMLFSRGLLCENRNPQTMSPCNKCQSCKSFLAGNHPSYVEVDAANYGTKENMSAILDSLHYAVIGDYRVVYMDEVHRISNAGKDALLRILETPMEDDKTVFIFSTTELQKMPNTLRGRCCPIPLTRPSHDDVFSKLERMCKEEGVSYDRHALYSLAVWAQGHFRDAENALLPLVLLGGINSANVAYITTYDVEATSQLLVALDSDLSRALALTEEMSSKYGAEAIHASLIRVLLDAIRYGLSGTTLDVPECVKAVYNSFGARMGSILNYFTVRGKITDSRQLQAEIVSARYRFLRGDMEAGKASVLTTTYTATAVPVQNSSTTPPPVVPGTPGASMLTQQRLLKSQSRKTTPGGMIEFKESISNDWGAEEVPSSVSISRA